MNCTDPMDKGELCWSEKLQASFIGAYFYGYALQLVVACAATKAGFSSSTRLATLVSGVIQLSAPSAARYSGQLAAVLQGVKGLAAGVFMSGSFECAEKWGHGTEGNWVVSIGGTMLYAGFGIGPFMTGLLTERLGWEYPFYISGIVFLLLLAMHCVFVPNDPLEAWLMPENEKITFREKKNEEATAKFDSKSHILQRKDSIASILRRRYPYFISIYNIGHLFLTYPEQTVIPFFFHKFLDADTEFLSTLQLGLGLTTVVSGMGWKILSRLWDAKISWLKSRMGLMVIPAIIRSVNLAMVPFTNDIRVSVALLAVNNLLVGSIYGGGMMTLTYELDPYSGPVVVALSNGMGQAAGILLPFIRVAVTKVDDGSAAVNWLEYEVRWRWFFILCSAMGMVGVLSMVVGMVGWRNEWRQHYSIIEGGKTSSGPGSTNPIEGEQKGFPDQNDHSLTISNEAFCDVEPSDPEKELEERETKSCNGKELGGQSNCSLTIVNEAAYEFALNRAITRRRSSVNINKAH